MIGGTRLPGGRTALEYANHLEEVGGSNTHQFWHLDFLTAAALIRELFDLIPVEQRHRLHIPGKPPRTTERVGTPVDLPLPAAPSKRRRMGQPAEEPLPWETQKPGTYGRPADCTKEICCAPIGCQRKDCRIPKAAAPPKLSGGFFG